MTHPVKAPKKLIEVALPLDAINAAAAREKSIRHGHPSTLHLWWARRPLAAARAVIFAQLVNDPSWKWELENPGKVPPANLKASWAASRKRLFAILTDLVKWENTTNEDVLEKARAEIRKSWRETCELNKDHPQTAELFNPDKLPGLHDPFAGGGTIPLEAQRLGLEAYASDLNPVAVLINKAMIEIPPRFAGRPPVGPLPPGTQVENTTWPGATGLAEDVRRYGAWMRAEAEKRIGHLYPQIEITEEVVKERPDLKLLKGQRLTVVAWLWARTVKSPNPAYSHVEVPLASTFILSNMKDNEAFVEPVVMGDSYRFTVKSSRPPASAKNGTTAGKRAAFKCLFPPNVPISYDHIRDQGRAGHLGQRLMAVVAEGERGRVYLAPTDEMEAVAQRAKPAWKPTLELPDNARDFKTPNYGLKTFGDLFTPRQLVALTTFSDLVGEARERARMDAIKAGVPDDGKSVVEGGSGAGAYAEAIASMLAFTVSRLADRCSSICSWDLRDGQGRKPGIRNVFSRQAIQMTWDYAEANPLSEIAASVASAIWRVSDVLERLPSAGAGTGVLADAATQTISAAKIVSTDPPYYDNIGYADLSDFFYVWLRRSLRQVFPELFAHYRCAKSRGVGGYSVSSRLQRTRRKHSS